MSSPQRILIVRLTALGDIVHGLPVATALRNQFPNAFLAWAVEGGGIDLVRDHSALDHVISLPRRWWKSWGAISRVRKELTSLQFDTTVDLQGLTKSAVLAWLSGAPRRIGPDGIHGREFSKWLNNELATTSAHHVVDRYLELLKPLGIVQPEAQFELPISAGDDAYAQRVLCDLGLDGREFAILNPGAGWPSKVWPAERYGHVARYLHDRHGIVSLAVWGIAPELPDAQRIVATSEGAARLAPPTTLGQLAAISRRARLFVGSDTGPMHIAVAVGTPTVSMHGTSQAEVCGAYGEHNVRLQVYYADGTARERRAMDNAAMRAISVEMVTQACGQMLSSKVARRAS